MGPDAQGKKRRSVPIFRWFIIISLPFILTLWTVRLLISWNAPSYPEFEYPRISPDIYGFSAEERLEFAEATLEFLRQNDPAEEVIYMLENLTLPGSDSELYNSREIGHMLDVKHLVDLFNQVLRVCTVQVIAVLLVGHLCSTHVEGRQAYCMDRFLVSVAHVKMVSHLKLTSRD